jgi:hypothetical protein
VGKNNPFYGKKHTKESIEKISESNKNSVKTKEHKKKISESNKKTKRNKARKNAKSFIVIKNDKIVGEWDLAVECAEDLCLIYGSVLKCLKGKQKTHKGFRFMYKEE